MLLNELNVQNYKGIDKQDLSFKEGINLLIGDNGAGKTNVLSAISIVLSVIVQLLIGKGCIDINKEDVHYEQKKIGDTISNFVRSFPVEVIGIVNFNKKNIKLGRILKNLNLISMQNTLIGCEKKDEIRKALEEVYPLISYQKSDREWKLKSYRNKKNITIAKDVERRERGYDNCLFGTWDGDIIQQWCFKMALIEFERKTEVKEFRLFQKIVGMFLQNLEETDKDINVFYSSEVSGLVYDDGESRTTLYDLSTGYRAILSMIMELAYRAIVLNPEMSEDLKDIKGIILIDNIEKHLHPKWQWRILDALKTTFPHVQFIITTHSPMIISSAKNANIINLNKERGVTYLDSVYGFSTGDVLTLRQGTVDMPMEAKMQLDAFEQALDDADNNRVHDILDKTRIEYGKNSAIYVRLQQIYNLNSWIDDFL